MGKRKGPWDPKRPILTYCPKPKAPDYGRELARGEMALMLHMLRCLECSSPRARWGNVSACPKRTEWLAAIGSVRKMVESTTDQRELR